MLNVVKHLTVLDEEILRGAQDDKVAIYFLHLIIRSFP